jgi:5-methylthioribose kinase
MTAQQEIAKSLVAKGLAQESAGLVFTPLTGGVSSDIWCVTGGRIPLCVKRARGQLAVEAKWEVPVDRNHFEAEFMRVTGKEVLGFAPDLLAEDEAQGFIVLPYLDPSEWQLWKPQLLAGQVDLDVARAVGTHLGRLARVTRNRPELLRQFDTTELFHALRLDPYLLECARKHPDLAPALTALSEDTASRREALVHGDVSPKNILVSHTSSAVVLDAECAWYGDPAFDLAFVLNHLVLKSVHRPSAAPALRAAMRALLQARAAADAPEHAEAVQRRAAALLPALLLARVDGKSPVEYLVDPDTKAAIRTVARQFLRDPTAHPDDIAAALTGDEQT